VTLIGIVLSVLIAFLAGRILTRRLAVIQQVADNVNAGNSDSAQRVVLAGDDEAARLATQFNGMLDSLAERKAAYFAQNQRSMQEINDKVVELDRVNSELEGKNKEMESMIYTASHDLRSPLVNIQGFSQRLEKAVTDINTRLAQDDVPEKVRTDLARTLNERIPSALGFIKASSLKMDMLINGLLRLSRAGRAQLTIEPLDMTLVLRAVVDSLAIQAHQAGATIRVDPLPACLGDSTQINQVFSNLIDNAIKYRDPARPLEVHITGSSDGQRARYEVTDTGLGIAEKFQPRVWELFHRLDPNGPIPGEGLGLTMVQRILARHGGGITLASSPGKGSCFTVELPAAFLKEKPQ
jgi:signal transduction histidine kinase